MDLSTVQYLLLPGGVGTLGVLLSTVDGVSQQKAVRLSSSTEVDHPYRPWLAGQDDVKLFRAHKAMVNSLEWTFLTLPLLWTAVLFTPSIPYLGLILPWAACVLAIMWGFHNTAYVKCYIEAAEKRVAPFKKRTDMFKGLFFMSVAGVLATLLKFICHLATEYVL